VIPFALAAQIFVGANACVPCHSKIVELQTKTPHAGALRPATDGRVKADWAFGAGSQAVTYVSRLDEDTYLEHPLSYYARLQGLAPTPGHKPGSKGERYRTFAPDAAILRCFQCHSTGALAIDARRSIRPAELGVRCESCHGAGSEHARQPSKANIGKAENCATCHRMPPAKGVATNWHNPWNVRHQPVYLSQSRCFLESAGKLRCVTCHDPHSAEPVNATARCLSCHAKPHVTESCAGCHMPVVELEPGLRFSNHWIGVYQMPLSPGNRLRPLPQRPRGGGTAALIQK